MLMNKFIYIRFAHMDMEKYITIFLLYCNIQYLRKKDTVLQQHFLNYYIGFKVAKILQNIILNKGFYYSSIYRYLNFAHLYNACRADIIYVIFIIDASFFLYIRFKNIKKGAKRLLKKKL